MRGTTAPKKGTLGLVSSGLRMRNSEKLQEFNDPTWLPEVTTPFAQLLTSLATNRALPPTLLSPKVLPFRRAAFIARKKRDLRARGSLGEGSGG